MGPERGNYQTAEVYVPTEIHLNHGPAGCEWAVLPPEPPLYENALENPLICHWIEDRKAERAQAMVELTISQNQLTVSLDGN